MRGSFRTRADSITNKKAELSGERKKFNVNFIVKIGVFLYNLSAAGVSYIISFAIDFKKSR